MFTFFDIYYCEIKHLNRKKKVVPWPKQRRSKVNMLWLNKQMPCMLGKDSHFNYFRMSANRINDLQKSTTSIPMTCSSAQLIFSKTFKWEIEDKHATRVRLQTNQFSLVQGWAELNYWRLKVQAIPGGGPHKCFPPLGWSRWAFLGGCWTPWFLTVRLPSEIDLEHVLLFYTKIQPLLFKTAVMTAGAHEKPQLWCYSSPHSHSLSVGHSQETQVLHSKRHACWIRVYRCNSTFKILTVMNNPLHLLPHFELQFAQVFGHIDTFSWHLLWIRHFILGSVRIFRSQCCAGFGFSTI